MGGDIDRRGQAIIGTLISDNFGTNATFVWYASDGSFPGNNNVSLDGANYIPHRCPLFPFPTIFKASAIIPASSTTHNIPHNYTKDWYLWCPAYHHTH